MEQGRGVNPTRLVQRSSPGKGMNGLSPASVGAALLGGTEVTTLLRAHGSLSLAQCPPLDWSLSRGDSSTPRRMDFC